MGEHEHPRITERRMMIAVDRITEIDRRFLERLDALSRLARTVGTQAQIDVIVELGAALEELILQLRRVPASSDAGLFVRRQIGETLDTYQKNLKSVIEAAVAAGRG